ncbi:hypothetical protein PV327_004872 [Microctonus hyperodae]|uniref:Prostaglandin reductase 1 n=1 Tax=Microctonus hyperodae TaxID=165561 RepID=A0AA39FDC4_MICHY|nr:hypothetical protein PV327_004872 [Microctonus hyperodae]
MRVYSTNFPLNTTMVGSQVALIVASKDPEFPVGKRIIGYFGWRTHTIVNMKATDENEVLGFSPQLIAEVDDLPMSLYLGVLGMPGMTAYFGFQEICKPKSGETLVVSGAAGAVGSHVGQIGKILGMKVIGIAGSNEKCQWLTKEVGFDHAINYKTEDIAVELKKLAPNGVDCYFDNVGGEISSKIIYQMKDFGRISVCGAISSYNADSNDTPKCSILQPYFVFKQLKMEGFIVTRWIARMNESVEQNIKWIRESKLIYRETVTEGFDNMFNAFAGILRGENTGKAIVKV